MVPLSKPTQPVSVKGLFMVLIMIMLGLGGLAFYFFNLQEDYADRFEQKANEYHLTAAQYNLKIKGNLSFVEKILLVISLEMVVRENEGDISPYLNNDPELSSDIKRTLWFIDQDLKSILQLQKKYSNPQLEKTTQRLNTQVQSLNVIWRNSLGNGD